ncbi:unnamed protein product [Lepeophtheirus salmonis]|uniref:(salmon louse) hypothetical protein n=1 Tax=Lepeophtheirus salmonis TaxID=72036 RepID=A0A7R8D6R0_LEPSM|nr:unnamed protein product [Lepeophtheirus salmonis]CAF3020058.1 unnamed protein product [Lepeophtheirus salmonis]
MPETEELSSKSPDILPIIQLWTQLKHRFNDKIVTQDEELAESKSLEYRISNLENQIFKLRQERSSLNSVIAQQQNTLTQFCSLQKERELARIRCSKLENELVIKSEELSVVAVERKFDIESLETKHIQELGKIKLNQEREIREMKQKFEERLSSIIRSFEEKEAQARNNFLQTLDLKEKEMHNTTERYESKFVNLEDQILCMREAHRESPSVQPRMSSDVERFYKKRLADMRTYYENKLQSPTQPKSVKEKKKISFNIPEESEPNKKFIFKI